jgi:hypothetical protein
MVDPDEGVGCIEGAEYVDLETDVEMESVVFGAN